MSTKKQKQKSKSRKTCYNKLPTQVLQKDFNRYVLPYLSKSKRGRKPKLSYYKIFNYVLYVLHTGIQWGELRTYRNEICWTNIYKHHNRWSKDGSYQKLFAASVERLKDTDKLDLSALFGDGSNVVAKKGGRKSATPDTNTRKARKPLPLPIN
jgi:transposase